MVFYTRHPMLKAIPVVRLTIEATPKCRHAGYPVHQILYLYITRIALAAAAATAAAAAAAAVPAP